MVRRSGDITPTELDSPRHLASVADTDAPTRPGGVEQPRAPEAWTDHHAGLPLLAIRQLTRRFGRRTIVDSLDLTLEAGDRVALCGPNGSGKSTILRCIAGTLQPTSGEIEVNGRPAGSVAARDQIGCWLSQDRSFYLRLTGRENLMFFARLRVPDERAARNEVRAILDELELHFAGDRVDRYSSGMLQQLGFARALLGAPKLLLLDEPTRSLDTEARARLWRALDHRRQTGVLIATHNSEDLERCGARLDLAP